MAEAIVRGMLRAGRRASDIRAADPSSARRALFASLGVKVVERVAELADSDTLLLSVKPQVMPEVLHELSPVITPGVLLVSIAAGISTGKIEQGLGGRPFRVVRTMPNTPLLVGQGAVAIAPGRHATADDLAVARALFESSAVVVEVREELMDAVTAVSGSGPAYVFFLVEQMTAAGIELGLDPQTAETLARQTVAGAGRVLAAESEPPAELRRRVTSPGGTTQAAIEWLERHDWPGITRSAIAAARDRGRELGKV
mgnify:CR=1 FL=1